MKKILILGGTVFVGRMLTEKLIATAQYDVTLFNRGKSNTGLFKDVKQIHGDRETEDIQQVYNQHWDCIIDFSGYYPNTFAQLLKNIKANVGRYIFISTISVYNTEKSAGQLMTESFETLACTEEQKTSKLPDAYGEKKAEMERLLLAQKDMDVIVFRPSYIYGKFDWTQRFYYWLYRVERGLKFLLPDNGQPKDISLTNADDLAEALLRAIEIEKHATIYNTISTPSISVRQLVAIASKTYAKPTEIITTNVEALEKLSVQPHQFPLVSSFGFSVSDALWKKDFPFTRKDIATELVEMRDNQLASGFPKPKAGLDVDAEKDVIEKNGL